jgi:hypothetical protein
MGVDNVFLNSIQEKMTKEQAIDLVEKNQEKLKLTDQQFNRCAGKRYLVLIELENMR